MTDLTYLQRLLVYCLSHAAAHMAKLGLSAEQRRAVWLALAAKEDGSRWWSEWLL